jgi:hypothetical protein
VKRWRKLRKRRGKLRRRRIEQTGGEPTRTELYWTHWEIIILVPARPGLEIVQILPEVIGACRCFAVTREPESVFQLTTRFLLKGPIIKRTLPDSVKVPCASAYLKGSWQATLGQPGQGVDY